MAGGAPFQLACLGVEGADAEGLAAHDDVHAAIGDERRAAGAEEAFFGAVPLLQIGMPELLAGGEIDGVEHALGAVGVDDAIDDGGRGTGAVIEAEFVFVGCGVLEVPDGFAGLRVEGFDDFAEAFAVEEDDLPTGDDGAGETVADFAGPGDLGRPLNVGAGVDAVARRTEELGPIQECEQAEPELRTHWAARKSATRSKGSKPP